MKKELKVLLFLIISLIAFTPNIVLANIRCNDGTYSPTCTYNHSGCCSHHGGVADSGYSSSKSYFGLSSKNNNGSSNFSEDNDLDLYLDYILDPTIMLTIGGSITVLWIWILVFIEIDKKNKNK